MLSDPKHRKGKPHRPQITAPVGTINVRHVGVCRLCGIASLLPDAPPEAFDLAASLATELGQQAAKIAFDDSKSDGAKSVREDNGNTNDSSQSAESSNKDSGDNNHEATDDGNGSGTVKQETPSEGVAAVRVDPPPSPNSPHSCVALDALVPDPNLEGFVHTSCHALMTSGRILAAQEAMREHMIEVSEAVRCSYRHLFF